MLLLVIIFTFILAILVSLGVALRHLLKDGTGSSDKMVKFLTLRIALSVALFLLLLLAWYLGWIQPHPLAPPAASG